LCGSFVFVYVLGGVVVEDWSGIADWEFEIGGRGSWELGYYGAEIGL
jgi:hypothetical protein